MGVLELILKPFPTLISRTGERFQGDSSVEELLTFLRDHAAPLVGQMTKKNAATRYSKLPLVVVYYNVDFTKEYRDGTQYWRNKVCSGVL